MRDAGGRRLRLPSKVRMGVIQELEALSDLHGQGYLTGFEAAERVRALLRLDTLHEVRAIASREQVPLDDAPPFSMLGLSKLRCGARFSLLPERADPEAERASLWTWRLSEQATRSLSGGLTPPSGWTPGEAEGWPTETLRAALGGDGRWPQAVAAEQVARRGATMASLGPVLGELAGRLHADPAEWALCALARWPWGAEVVRGLRLPPARLPYLVWARWEHGLADAEDQAQLCALAEQADAPLRRDALTVLSLLVPHHGPLPESLLVRANDPRLPEEERGQIVGLLGADTPRRPALLRPFLEPAHPLRETALRAVADWGPEAGPLSEALLAGLKPDCPEALILALAALGPAAAPALPEVEAELRALLDRGRWPPARAMALLELLGAMGASAIGALPWLLDHLEQPGVARVACTLAALAPDAVFERLEDAEGRPRLRLLEVLAGGDPPAQAAMPVLARALSDADARIALTAVSGLARGSDALTVLQAAWQTFIRWTDTPEPPLTELAWHRAALDLCDALAPYLEDRSPGARTHAVRALGWTREYGAQHLPTLRAMEQDPDVELAEAAAEAVARLEAPRPLFRPNGVG